MSFRWVCLQLSCLSPAEVPRAAVTHFSCNTGTTHQLQGLASLNNLHDCCSYGMMVPVKKETFDDSGCSIILPLFPWEMLTFKAPSLLLIGSVSLHLLSLLCVFYLICKVIFIPVWLSAVLQHHQLSVYACACVSACGGIDKCSTKISSMTCCWESRAWKFRLSISDSSFAWTYTHKHKAWGLLIPQHLLDRHKPAAVRKTFQRNSSVKALNT